MTTDVDHLDDPNDPDSDYGRGYQAALDAERHPVTTPDPPDLRASIRATYDSRKTGPRYWVTTEIEDETIAFREPLDDPFVRCTVRVSWLALLRGLLRRQLFVTVLVGGDIEVMNDVLELDENTLIPGRTRKAAFRQSLNERLREVADHG